MLELDPTKLPQRIAVAYQAILDRVEELHRGRLMANSKL
jgi:hypothetical protein